MASNRNDSTSSSDRDEDRVFTRSVRESQLNVERAKKILTFESATSIPATDCITRPSTSTQQPVTDQDDVASPLSSYHDDSDFDKTVDPSQLSEDSSDNRSRRAERRAERVAEDRKKKLKGFSSGKSPFF